jgi:cyanamide hydratase
MTVFKQFVDASERIEYLQNLNLATRNQISAIQMSLATANAYGWSPVPRSLDKLIASTKPANSQPISTSILDSLPSDTLSKKVLAYATQHLPAKTLNHSLRVFLYGQVLLTQHFPDLIAQPQFLETYYLTCLLHDIGTSEENLSGTKMSFDFYGGIVAMQVLREFGAEKDMAEAVCEAIIRHQDLGDTGTITSLGGVIQLATVFGKLIRQSKPLSLYLWVFAMDSANA